MRIDWQAYEDGTMPADHRLLVDKALHDDTGLQRELDSFRLFKNAICASIEPIHANLNVHTPVKMATRRRLIPVALAASLAIAATAAWYQASLRRPGPPPKVNTVFISCTIDDPVEAQEFITKKGKFQPPLVKLKSLAIVNGATAREGAGTYRFIMGRYSFDVTVRTDREHYDKDRAITHAGKPYRKTKQGVSWSDDEFAYEVIGLPEKETWTVIDAVRKDTGT